MIEGAGASEKAVDYKPHLGIWTSVKGVSVESYHLEKNASVMFARVMIELFICFVLTGLHW